MSKSSVSRVLELVKKTDLYSSSIDVAFENGKRSLKSWFGVCVGLTIPKTPKPQNPKTPWAFKFEKVCFEVNKKQRI